MSKLRRLGNSNLEITPVGIGAWAMGGGNWAFAWGPQDDRQSIETIHRALDLGMNWIDTAGAYGLGHSEEVVGRAIKGITERPYIFTKCSRVADGKGGLMSSLKRDSIKSECEKSLKLLGIEAIDLYQVHRGAPDEDLEEGWSAMAELQKEGKVRWIGVSNFTVDQMMRCASIAPITSLQPPYSLIRREIEKDLLPYCQENGIGVLAYSPMGSGLLTGKMTAERIAALPDDDWRKRSENFQEPKLARNLAGAEQLAGVGARRGKTAAETAIAWVLANPAVTAAIVGLRTPQQAEEAIGAMEYRLSAEELAKLTSTGAGF